MQQFLLIFHGSPQFKSKEEGMAHMKNWNAWTDGLGEGLIEPGKFLGMSKTVSSDGVADDGGSNPTSGITVVQAGSIEAAIEMAKACPHIDKGGTIEVAPIMKM